MHSYDKHTLFSFFRTFLVGSIQHSPYIIYFECLPDNEGRHIRSVASETFEFTCCHSEEKPYPAMLLGLFGTSLHLDKISIFGPAQMKRVPLTLTCEVRELQESNDKFTPTCSADVGGAHVFITHWGPFLTLWGPIVHMKTTTLLLVWQNNF